MSKTTVELHTDAMRRCFTAAFAQTTANNSPQPQIFSLLISGTSALQRILYYNEDNLVNGEEPLLTKSEEIDLIEEALLAFILVVNNQLMLLKADVQEEDS